MFVPYSSEYSPEHRPVMAFVTFPLVVALSFWAITENPGQFYLQRCLFLGFVDISGLFFMAYAILCLPVLWTFSIAVCSRIGNIVYLLLLGTVAGLYWMLFFVMESSLSYWFMSLAIHFAAGMFLVFYPTNEVYCFLYIPPFRTFALSGIWVILLWICFDLLFCLVFGWEGAIVMHPIMLLLYGSITAVLLVVSRLVRLYPDERTIWQIFRKEESEDRCWRESWSRRRNEQQMQTEQQETQDREAVKQAAKKKPTMVAETGTPVLCACGEVVYVGGTGTRCPGCGHVFPPADQGPTRP